MNYYQYPGQQYHYVRPKLLRGAVREIIIINVVVFVIMYLLRTQTFFLRYFGLVPQLVLKGYIWQLLTYLFIHGGFWHLFWNMFILWMFGAEIENYWGRREFLKFYLFCGIGSGLITFLFSLNSSIPVVGASGAIYAVLVAFALMFPDRLVYFYFLIPIRAKYFVWIIVAITFFSTLSPNISNISHLTHLGGLAIGYIYLKRRTMLSHFTLRLPHINWHIFRFRPWKRKSRPAKPRTPHYQTEETMREELDRILDQISHSGYDSLSEQEKTTLLLLSKYFADKERAKS